MPLDGDRILFFVKKHGWISSNATDEATFTNHPKAKRSSSLAELQETPKKNKRRVIPTFRTPNCNSQSTVARTVGSKPERN